MYRRTTAKVYRVSKDLSEITIKLPISYKNRNYANTIFGGSMFAAVDPIPMVQLLNIIGNDYVVWDKAAHVSFKRPAKVDLYADFVFTPSEVASILEKVTTSNEIEIEKVALLQNKERDTVYCEIKKTIYIANKAYYKAKRKKRQQKSSA